MRIERERFVIVKKSRHGAMILCTVANKPKFCYILRLDGELIRSYMSEAKARQAFKRHFGAWNPKRYRVLRVIETYQNVQQNSRLLKELRQRMSEETHISESIPRFVDGDGAAEELDAITMRPGTEDGIPHDDEPFDLDVESVETDEDTDGFDEDDSESAEDDGIDKDE